MKKYTTKQLAEKSAKRRAWSQGNYYGTRQNTLTCQQIIEQYKLNTSELYAVFVKACNKRRERDEKPPIDFTPYKQLNISQLRLKIAKTANNTSVAQNADNYQLKIAHLNGYAMARSNPQPLKTALTKYFDRHKFFKETHFEKFFAGYNAYQKKNNLALLEVPAYKDFFQNKPSTLPTNINKKNARLYRSRSIYSRAYSKGMHAKSADDYRKVRIDFPEFDETDYNKFCIGFKAGILKNKSVTATNISFDDYTVLYPEGSKPKNILESEARKMQVRRAYNSGYYYGLKGKSVSSKEDFDTSNDSAIDDEWLDGHTDGNNKRLRDVTQTSGQQKSSTYVGRPILNLMNANNTSLNANNEVPLDSSSSLLDGGRFGILSFFKKFI